jgi:hypothetical protein
MAHYPKPFFRASRGVWYVQIDGKQINLGPDKHAAFKAYHAQMQQRVETPITIHPTAAKLLVVVIVDEYLDWCEKHRAPDTYRWYKDRLESFCKTIEATLTVDQLRPHHVQKWVDNYGVPLKSGSQRNLIASVKRAMKWAEEQGYIERSPIAHMKKPGCGRKEQVVSPQQYQALLARYKDQEFKDLLTVTSNVSPVSLISGDPINIQLVYSGSTLTESLFDTTTLASFSTTDLVLTSIPTTVGGSTAFIGLTAGSPGDADEFFSNFQFTTSVPEPASCGLLGIGATAALMRRRKV